LDILVPRGLKGILADMLKAAQANGIEVLKAALSALEKHDISALEEMSKRARAAISIRCSEATIRWADR
jgi:hypothetical protein